MATDLTEVGGDLGTYFYKTMKPKFLKMLREEKVTTPAAILVTASAQPWVREALAEHGWVNYRVTLNWHTAHVGDRTMRLWHKSYPTNVPTPKDKFKLSWTPRYHEQKSSGFGCGFGYGSGKPTVMGTWKNSDLYFRLFRVEKSTRITPNDEKKFRSINFKPIFETCEAVYYCNGFPPSKWKGNEWERKYWTRKLHHQVSQSTLEEPSEGS
jgi:hypothetical protein